METSTTQKNLYANNFNKQNSLIGNYLDIDPNWIHIARQNYRYIFSELDAYWPNWALKQFNPKHIG